MYNQRCPKCIKAWKHSVGLSSFCSNEHYRQFLESEAIRKKDYNNQKLQELKDLWSGAESESE